MTTTRRWYVYIVKCSDESLYTGVTTDVVRRVYEHNNDNKKASKYCWSRRPVVCVGSQEVDSKQEAYRLERQIKDMKRSEKLQITQGHKIWN